MSEKRIVYKVPSEVKKQSIETLKVRKTHWNISVKMVSRQLKT